MLSNPPYIPSAEILDLQIEVREHEPRLALDGGEDGLTALRYLVATAPDYLRDGIYELRAKHIHVQYRILYFFDGQNIAILAHAIIGNNYLTSTGFIFDGT